MNRWIFAVVVGGSFAASGGEATYVFQSQEDASTPPDAAVCAAAPFATNVKLGASLWSIDQWSQDGRVKPHQRRIGRATACLQLTNVLFPRGSRNSSMPGSS